MEEEELLIGTSSDVIKILQRNHCFVSSGLTAVCYITIYYGYFLTLILECFIKSIKVLVTAYLQAYTHRKSAC